MLQNRYEPSLKEISSNTVNVFLKNKSILALNSFIATVNLRMTLTFMSLKHYPLQWCTKLRSLSPLHWVLGSLNVFQWKSVSQNCQLVVLTLLSTQITWAAFKYYSIQLHLKPSNWEFLWVTSLKLRGDSNMQWHFWTTGLCTLI